MKNTSHGCPPTGTIVHVRNNMHVCMCTSQLFSVSYLHHNHHTHVAERTHCIAITCEMISYIFLWCTRFTHIFLLWPFLLGEPCTQVVL